MTNDPRKYPYILRTGSERPRDCLATNEQPKRTISYDWLCIYWPTLWVLCGRLCPVPYCGQMNDYDKSGQMSYLVLTTDFHEQPMRHFLSQPNDMNDTNDRDTIGHMHARQRQMRRERFWRVLLYFCVLLWCFSNDFGLFERKTERIERLNSAMRSISACYVLNIKWLL